MSGTPGWSKGGMFDEQKGHKIWSTRSIGKMAEKRELRDRFI